MDTCHICQGPIYGAIQDVTFTTGVAPTRTITMRLQAKWCARPECFQKIIPLNYYNHDRGDFIDEMCRCRDMLQPIAEGLIERGCRVSQYDDKPGKRKTKLSDAKEIAARVIARINKAINVFIENESPLR